MGKIFCLAVSFLILPAYVLGAEKFGDPVIKGINEYSIQVGNVVEFIKLEDSIIRYIADKNRDDENDYSGYVAQGHIKNISKNTIIDVKIDISFYDKDMKFLGLNEMSIFEFDKIDPAMSRPFSIDLDIPKNADIFRINIAANKGGWLDKFF